MRESIRLPRGWWRHIEERTLGDVKRFALGLSVPALLLGLLGIATSWVEGETVDLVVGVLALAIAVPYLWWLLFRARRRLIVLRGEIRQELAAKGL